jgi:hypothetical protein
LISEALPAQPNCRVARDADRFRGEHRGLQVFARIELRRVLVEELANGPGHREPDVGVDIDLAHAGGDAFLGFLDWNSPYVSSHLLRRFRGSAATDPAGTDDEPHHQGGYSECGRGFP